MTTSNHTLETETDYEDRREVSGGAGVKWTGRTRGGVFGNWFFLQVVRLAGLRVAYVLVLPVVAYFLIAGSEGRRSSVDYLNRVLGPQPAWKLPLHVYRHFLSLAVTLLDRVAVITGKAKIKCSFDGEDILRESLAAGNGLILLGAHVGNWDVGGHLLNRLGKPVNLVVLDNELESIRHLFRDVAASRHFKILTCGIEATRSIPILAALKRGEIVALHGDRVFGGETVSVPFLGALANFPVGAYLLASASRSPICQSFAAREGMGRYRFFCFPPQRVDAAARRNRRALGGLVAVYARRLESVVQRYPYQWYNFFPFWNEPPGETPG